MSLANHVLGNVPGGVKLRYSLRWGICDAQFNPRPAVSRPAPISLSGDDAAEGVLENPRWRLQEARISR